MLTDSIRKHLCRIVGLYDKKRMSFATVLCLIPENVYRRLKKYREMDWQLVASYFTVKSTDKFYSVEQLDWPLKTLKERRKQRYRLHLTFL